MSSTSNDRDLGQQSVGCIQQAMETKSEDLVFIFAGYEGRKDRCCSYLSCLSWHAEKHLSFSNYNDDDLIEITEVRARDVEYKISDGASALLNEYLEARMDTPYVSNACALRSPIDRPRKRFSICHFH